MAILCLVKTNPGFQQNHLMVQGWSFDILLQPQDMVPVTDLNHEQGKCGVFPHQRFRPKLVVHTQVPKTLRMSLHDDATDTSS